MTVNEMIETIKMAKSDQRRTCSLQEAKIPCRPTCVRPICMPLPAEPPFRCCVAQLPCGVHQLVQQGQGQHISQMHHAA